MIHLHRINAGQGDPFLPDIQGELTVRNGEVLSCQKKQTETVSCVKAQAAARVISTSAMHPPTIEVQAPAGRKPGPATKAESGDSTAAVR
ncbi:MAG: hypothetical protein AAGI44_19770 [Pseudomonadota bacterium]